MRKSDLILSTLGASILLFILTLVDARLREQRADSHLDEMYRQTRELELTDLSLFTEARYTRHLSQSDRHSAFQDPPLAIEHFPTGSLVTPPQHLTTN